MTEKIKACPYCPVPTVTMVFNPDGDDAFVECSRCKTQGPSGKNEAEAIAKWNAAANALEQKDAEIEKLNKIQHQLNAEIERQKLAYSHWYAEHCRVEAGKRRQDELEAEIAHLTAACDDLEGEYLRMKDERDELEAEIARLTAACDDLEGEYLRMKDERDELEAEIARLTAACDDLEGEYLRMKEHSENLMLRINQLEEYKEIWYKRAKESLNQRDEARKVARVWYNVAGVWKEKAEANDIDKIEDELMEYCKQQQARKVIYWVDGTNETTRTEPQTIRVETTDKETP